MCVLLACYLPSRDLDGSAGNSPPPQHCADCGYKCISCRLAYPVPRSLALYPGVNRKGSLGRLRPGRVHTQYQTLKEGGGFVVWYGGGGGRLEPHSEEEEGGYEGSPSTLPT